jgi:hypothetical protein
MGLPCSLLTHTKEVNNVDIGPEGPPIQVEPAEDPFEKRRRQEPAAPATQPSAPVEEPVSH